MEKRRGDRADQWSGRVAAFVAWQFYSIACLAQMWPETRIDAPVDVTAGGRFGAAMAMQGDWLLVGAPGTNDGVPGSGAAYLYNRYEGGENAWGLVKKLEPPDPAGGAAFGTAVLLDGDRAYVSAPGEPWLVLPVGAVHVFERHMGGVDNWGHKQRIVPDTVQPGLAFGTFIAVDHDLLIVNAPGYDESTGDGSPGLGALIGFVRDTSSVLHETRFARGDALVDQVSVRPCVNSWLTVFGDQVVHASYFGALSVPAQPFADPGAPFGPLVDQPLPVGAGMPDVPIHFARGASDEQHLLLGVRNYSAKAPRLVSYIADGNGGLIPDGVIHPPDTLVSLTWWHWGDAIDIEGPLVAVGAYGDETFTPLGRVDVFRRDTDAPFAWANYGSLYPSSANTGDQFGRSVALAEGNVGVGAPGCGPNDAGTVFVFRDPDVGIRTPPSPRSFRVFPNPVMQGTALMHVDGTGDIGPVSFRIDTEEGRMVRDGMLGADAMVELPRLDPGVYVITVPGEQRRPPHAARFVVLP